MRKLVSTILAASILCAVPVAVSAADGKPAAAVVFGEDSGYKANTYTGFIEGVGLDTKAGDILAALTDSEGISIVSGDRTLGADDKVSTGCVLRLSDAAGAAKAEFKTIVPGDVNGDSKIAVDDAIVALKLVANWKIDAEPAAADVDGDGSVSVNDAIIMLKKIAGWSGVEPVKIPVKPDSYATSGLKDVATFVSGTREPINLRRGQVVGVKFSVGAKERASYITAEYPSWANDIGEITVKLYRRNTDYATTVAAMPVYEQKYVDFKDCSKLTFNLTDGAGHGLGEGDYLWTISGREASGGVGMWKNALPSESTGISTFYEGEPADFSVEASITYSLVK